MAGHPHRSGRCAQGAVAVPATPSIELDSTEDAPIARVHRHRLAFALVATVAALPILALDNLPATANTSHSEVPVVVTRFVPDESLRPVDTTAPPTTEATIPTEATTPTEAITTTVESAPPTTVAKVRAAALQQAPPVTSPPTTQAPAPTYEYGDPNDPATWDRMAECEADGNWAANTGNGYYGGLQFSLSTWQHYGGTGYPHQASRATQIQIGKRLQAARGWDAWPSCSRQLGYS